MVLRADLGRYGISQLSEERQIQADFAAFMHLLLEDAGLDMNIFPELISCIDRRNSTTFELCASSLRMRRTIFRTLKGCMELGPDILRRGDVAVALFDGEIPYILRSQKGYFLFFGEAYVHITMEGQVIKQWRDGAVQDEVFEIH
jgi:hypothetical protein